MSEAQELATWLGKLRLADRVLYAVVVLLLALAGVAPPLWGRFDPHLIVAQRFYAEVEGDEALDPWGRPWLTSPDGLAHYSSGPDGLDDGGGGDDVLVLRPGAAGDWRLPLYESLAGLLCSLAVMLLLGWEGARLLKSQLFGPRSPKLSAELARAGLWALPAAALVDVALWAFFSLEATAALAESIRQGLEEALVVPLPLALGGSVYLASFLLLLGLRLRLPLQESSLQQGQDPDR